MQHRRHAPWWLSLCLACTTAPGDTTEADTTSTTGDTTTADPSTGASPTTAPDPTTGTDATTDATTTADPTTADPTTAEPTTGDATTADATTGTTGEPARLPGDVLDLSNWKLTLPIDTDHPGSPDEIEQPELATFVDPLYYHLNDALDGVVFRAHTGGDTTDNSGYPRSELREMTDDGAEEAAWSSGVGTHRMDIDQKITHLPVAKPHIVVGQIHDDQDDVIVFRLEDTRLFIDLNGEDGPTLDPDYTLGKRFTVAFEVSDDHVDCYYNGDLVYTHEQAFTGAYFKAGAYVQSSCQGDKQVPDEECDAYGEVEIYGLSVTHQ
jgi:hypothetical protein